MDALLPLVGRHPHTGEMCLVLDGTRTAAHARCSYLFALEHLDGWRAEGQSVDLVFGTAFHGALERYQWEMWKGKGHEEAVKEAVVAGWQLGVKGGLSAADPSTMMVKTLQSLTRTVIWAADAVRDRPVELLGQQDRQGPLVEVHFLLDLGVRTPQRGIPLLWSGYVDEVLVPGTGVLWVGDHKTTKRSGGRGKFKPHWALPGYILAIDLLVSPWAGLRCRGALVNEYAIQVGGTAHRQEVVEYSTEGQVVEWLAAVLAAVEQIEARALRRFWPQNPDSCYICGFREACAADPASRLGALEHAGFGRRPLEERWDPSVPRVPWGKTMVADVPEKLVGQAKEMAGWPQR